MYKVFLKIISGLGVISALLVIVKNIKHPGFAPDIFSIPACYLIFTAFLLVFCAQFINKQFSSILFWFGDLLGLVLGFVFSVTYSLRVTGCTVVSGIPLSLPAIFTFSLILFLKIIDNKKHKT